MYVEYNYFYHLFSTPELSQLDPYKAFDAKKKKDIWGRREDRAEFCVKRSYSPKF